MGQQGLGMRGKGLEMYPGTRVWGCTQGQGSGDVPRDKGLEMYPGTRVWGCTQGQGSRDVPRDKGLGMYPGTRVCMESGSKVLVCYGLGYR